MVAGVRVQGVADDVGAVGAAQAAAVVLVPV